MEISTRGTKVFYSLPQDFLFFCTKLFFFFQQRRETISTNKVYTSVLRSLEDRSEIDTHTHTHIYARTHIRTDTYTDVV